MSDQYEPILDDADQEVGRWVETADGEIVAVDLATDEIVAALDEDGDMIEIEPGTAYIDWNGDDDLDPRFAELEQRLENAEQYAQQPMQVEYVDPGPDLDVLADDVDQQAEYLAAAVLGRPLLLDEKRRLHGEAMLDIAAGAERPDLMEAAGRLGDMGQGMLDLDSGNRGADHAARVEWMTTRLADNERQELAEHGLDDLTDPEPPATADAFDTDDHSERVEYMTNRLRGADVAPDQLYSSSDILESEDWDDE